MAGKGNYRILVAVAVLALVLTACQGGETGGGSEEAGVKTDIGVTTEPCPGGNAERDCIYLGVLSDLTEGPFRALAVPITEGQKAFWKRVNDQGGIAERYAVDIDTYTRDNKYNPRSCGQVRESAQILPWPNLGPRRPSPACRCTRRATSSPPPPPGGRAGSSRTSSWRAATATVPRP